MSGEEHNTFGGYCPRCERPYSRTWDSCLWCGWPGILDQHNRDWGGVDKALYYGLSDPGSLSDLIEELQVPMDPRLTLDDLEDGMAA